ncbi:MAG: serine/threonine-protein kinase [Gemmatimonadota bacterium]|nr:serine/threonine-protein kinase [Gemmatimonadota bacterium]
MPTSRWSRVDAVFAGALELPADERDGYVERACAGDAELRQEVEELLRAAESADTLIDRLAPRFDPGRHLAAIESVVPDGMEIGAYRVVRLLGEGGMGAVYLAERADGQFEQQVAIKLVQPWRLRGGELVQRFVRERQILARLQHPNIARLYDGGVTADGLPFLVMEFVEGRPITEYCESSGLSVDRRVRLLQDVGRAVQYAHRNLVIHRDLKPSNILVTDDGEVKLLDFGIAKLLAEDEDAERTRTGPVMTPAYAAPEQVAGADVTTATDVYTLGVLLFELLAGRRPNEDVPDAGQRAPAGGVHPAGGDLDLICRMALREEPERRYPSAQALVDDLQRYVDGHPVAARPDSMRYRTRKFVARHRGGVAAAALVLVSLVAGLGAALWQSGIAGREAATAREVSDFALGLFEVSDPDAALEAGDLTVRDLLLRGAGRIDEELAGQPEVQAEMYSVVGPIFRRLGMYDDARPLLVRAVELQGATSGRESVAYAAAVHELGLLETAAGEMERADSLLMTALAIYERAGGRHDLEIGRVLGALALVERTENREEIADSLFRLARAALARGEAPADEVYALSLAHAEILHMLGQTASADSVYTEVVERAEELSADSSLALARTLALAGQRASFEGDLERARQLLQNAIDLRRAALGDRHHDVAMGMSAMAGVLMDEGRLDEAIAMREEAVEMLEQTVGSRHVDYAMTLGALGVLQVRAGELERAATTFDETERIQAETLGDGHFHLAMTRRNYARTLMSLERYDEAVPRFELAIEGWIAAQGDQDFFTGPTRVDLARAYRQVGRAAEADSVLDQLLVRYRETPPGGAGLGDVLLLKSRLAASAEDREEAVSLAREAIAEYERQGITLGDVGRRDAGEGIQRARAEVALGEYLLDLGRFADAEPHLIAGYRAIETGRGADGPDAAEAREPLARLYRRTGRPEDAARLTGGS